MRILVLNGSPRPKGNTKQMVDAFREGAESAGHRVEAAHEWLGIGMFVLFIIHHILSQKWRRFAGRQVYSSSFV